jgi:hypothetical protein
MTAETPTIGGLYGSVTVVTPWQALTSHVDLAQVSQTSEMWNQKSHLEKFIDRASLYSLSISDSRLHIMVSDTPYAQRHAMLLLEDDLMMNSLDWKHGCIIHEQNEETRSLYFLSVLKTLEHFRRVEGSGSVVVFTENTTREVTHTGMRLPRSVRLIHGHVTSFQLEAFNQYGYVPEVDVSGFSEEIENWEQIHPMFLSGLNEYFPRSSGFIKREQVLPPGYFMDVHYTGATLENARDLANLLKTHHTAYTHVVGHISSVKPQPSYRTYIELLAKDVMRIGYSPILLSHAGSINAAGIFMNRVTDANFPIGEKRASESVLFQHIGKSIYEELSQKGIASHVLRSGYPY